MTPGWARFGKTAHYYRLGGDPLSPWRYLSSACGIIYHIEDDNHMLDSDPPTSGRVCGTCLRIRGRKHSPGTAGYSGLITWLFELYGQRCMKCGETDDLTVDHVIPRSKGGSDLANNLQVLCRACNSSKATNGTDYRPKPYEQVLHDRGDHVERLERAAAAQRASVPFPTTSRTIYWGKHNLTGKAHLFLNRLDVSVCPRPALRKDTEPIAIQADDFDACARCWTHFRKLMQW